MRAAASAARQRRSGGPAGPLQPPWWPAAALTLAAASVDMVAGVYRRRRGWETRRDAATGAGRRAAKSGVDINAVETPKSLPKWRHATGAAYLGRCRRRCALPLSGACVA